MTPTKQPKKDNRGGLFTWLRRQWRLLTIKEIHSTITPQEFKKMWNDNLESMKIRDL